jgi:hypothetical protein
MNSFTAQDLGDKKAFGDEKARGDEDVVAKRHTS